MQEKLKKVTKILNYIKSSYHSEMFSTLKSNTTEIH